MLDTSTTEAATTPMMAQWHACKKAAGDSVLLFRMGDFYEAFYDDAVILARELELTLTKRQEIPMAGVPHHTCEVYIDRLVAKGFRVAVAEQTEDPKLAKGLVKREVLRVVTPGTLIASSLLSEKNNNFIASITRVGKIYGMALLDLTTGSFTLTELANENDLLNELSKMQPSEIVVPSKFLDKEPVIYNELKNGASCLLTPHNDWHFEHQTAQSYLVNHFQVKSLEGFGLGGMLAAINAGGALLSYIHDTLSLPITHIKEIRPYTTSKYMSIDRATQKNLELLAPLHTDRIDNCLIHLLDDTKTAMGARLLRQWLRQPLQDVAAIAERQEAISALLNNVGRLQDLSNILGNVRDIERLIMRVLSGYATPRDVGALRRSLEPIPALKEIMHSMALGNLQAALLRDIERNLETHGPLVQLLSHALVDEPPARLSDGGVFRPGFSQELDELRNIGVDSKGWLNSYQARLRESTGIKSLKVGFTRMFGYYIEVSKGQSEKMPNTFTRRQTLVNAERFITPELKEFESKIMNAEERISALESTLFAQVREEVAKYGESIRKTAQLIALIDTLHSLAMVASKRDYTRPQVDDSAVIDIKEGRHPVIEAAQNGERFIPNDTTLDDSANRLLLITGPNMAGKSTYIRQVALIVIMAHIGSFVPAQHAHIGRVDKVFSRIGASDDLARGQSTFMVEMTETANILHNATSRSLVILDEIGRGTSTYDGISIAWSVAEYLLTTENKMAKTLFATHYCELTKLEEKVPGAINYNIAVHENGDAILFLRKIVRGGTDKSYGIHVGRLAGLPVTVIARAKEILEHLEENANRKSTFEPAPRKASPKHKSKEANASLQLTFFGK